MTELLWLPIIMVLLFFAWRLFRYLFAVWWLYCVFKPKVIELLEEALREETDECRG